MTNTITLEELARRAGVATSTLRYYERRGLITAQDHDDGRRYDEAALARLRVIHQLQQAGFALAEIIALLSTGADWQAHARRKRAEVDARIEGLTRAQQLLDAALACGCADLEGCSEHDPADAATHA